MEKCQALDEVITLLNLIISKDRCSLSPKDYCILQECIRKLENEKLLLEGGDFLSVDNLSSAADLLMKFFMLSEMYEKCKDLF